MMGLQALVHLAQTASSYARKSALILLVTGTVVSTGCKNCPNQTTIAEHFVVNIPFESFILKFTSIDAQWEACSETAFRS